MGTMLQVGETAPDFTAQDENGHTIRLAEFRGQKVVVLVFYPGDSTPLCTQQLCEFRDSYAELEKAGAAVFGVNPFGQGSHQRFTQRHAFNFPLLVDRGLAISRAFDTAGGWGPISWVKRAVIAIGTDGRILFAKKGKPDPSEVLEALRAAPQERSSHPGEAAG
jgi:peroxiredoxin Q/BCP